MSNSNNFLNYFNKIYKFLAQSANTTTKESFVSLVKGLSKAGNWKVKNYKDDLIQFAYLRNAIVHQSTGDIIAEPNDEIVKKISDVHILLTNPPRIDSLGLDKVLTLGIDDSVMDAVKVMYENSYSQVPVYNDEKFMDLLTSNTITRYLGSEADKDEEFILLANSKVEDVLEYREEAFKYKFLSRNDSLLDVIEIFEEGEKSGERLEAILVTQNAKVTDSLLKIITVWDLPEIYNRISK
ncbi:CBS domain protein [Orenia metallireducens]|uniref:CBS domain-containing protein n=1 Tax=Orenia metallireducens TaxID=1413210 RepID=A0A285I202_9FIRM|nr:CBS domain-containing protein [Orenia metallireducens]PRX23242.1 CBS domain protein [Orenia metallireducens]SNY42030.1 CBS domain-containing protein [Orenia metallireducens]